MRNITYKYNVGDYVKFKDKFSSPTTGLVGREGTVAKITGIAFAYNNRPHYHINNIEGEVFAESCFAGLATESEFLAQGSLAAEIDTLQAPETKCDTEDSGESKKKTKTNIELMTEALTELSDVLDYIASERGEDDTLYVALSGVETKLETVVSRYAKKVVQQ
jgi:hypothetical protein